MAHDEAVRLEAGQVLADRVGGHAEVRRDRFGAGSAFAPNELQDLQRVDRPAIIEGMRRLGADLNTLTDLLQVMLDKILAHLNFYGGET
jgi:hypothetical protein